VKQGVRILCTSAVRDTATWALRRYGLTMQFVGHIKMKGKAGDAEVFTPTTKTTTLSTWDILGLQPLVGRASETEMVAGALKGSPGKADGGQRRRVVVMVIEGEAGLGKSALLDHTLAVTSDPESPEPICFQHWLQLAVSQEEVLPFRMCSQIIEWLLELDGAPCAVDVSSWLTVRLRLPLLAHYSLWIDPADGRQGAGTTQHLMTTHVLSALLVPAFYAVGVTSVSKPQSPNIFISCIACRPSYLLHRLQTMCSCPSVATSPFLRCSMLSRGVS
jgi:hypothetical protein